MVTPYKHTAVVLRYLRDKTPEVILFYSGGKDSVVLLDLLCKHFDKVHCVFMYFVKDLRHLDPYIQWVQRYPNAVIHQLPHWMVSYYMANNFYSHPRPSDDIKAFKQVDVEEKAKRLTGCNWIVFGHKQADSMNRRLMLKGYTFDAINVSGQKVYPLSTWKKDNVKGYISMNRLIKPIEYGTKNSNGLDLTLDVMLWLRNNYPDDLERVYNVFPLSKQILFEYDYANQ